MASLLAAASGASKLFLGEGEPSIDNWTFRLFYQGTTSILLSSSVMVSFNQFFGDPIQCDLVRSQEPQNIQLLSEFKPGGGVSEDTLKTYCWMYSTFNRRGTVMTRCTIPTTSGSSCAFHSKLDKTVRAELYSGLSVLPPTSSLAVLGRRSDGSQYSHCDQPTLPDQQIPWWKLLDLWFLCLPILQLACWRDHSGGCSQPNVRSFSKGECLMRCFWLVLYW